MSSDDFEDDGLDEILLNLSNEAETVASRSNSSTTIVATQPQSQALPIVVPPASTPNGKQTTLTRNYVSTSSGAWRYQRNNDPDSSPGGPIVDKTTTHHELDPDALSIYIYPINLAPREYQQKIVKRALFENVLCALPTGLGKTFIASTVMLNFYRWTRTAKVLFMAPTRPLVSQQLEACLGITGLPRSDSSILIGGALTPAQRAVEWNTKRVFFATPQTVDNDLKRGILDPKTVACLVIDEAHRATGNQAYVEVVRFLNRFNTSFRVLALTATPSTTLEGVQAVIANLNISRVEIRTEESPDIKPYVHAKHIERVVCAISEDQESVLTPLCDALQPIVDQLYAAKVLFMPSATSVNQFMAVNAIKTLMRGNNGPPSGAQFKYLAMLKVLASMGHALALLKFHGITPFYQYLEAWESELGPKPGKYAAQLVNTPGYRACMIRCQELIYGGRVGSGCPLVVRRGFMGHPKLVELVRVMQEFFSLGGGSSGAEDSKVIIFSAYRDSGAEILRVLQENVGECKPHLFVGQASGRASTLEEGGGGAGAGGGAESKRKGSGMTQKEQQRVVEDFKQNKLNTLIATSIGEEGLDIGEVDLIICYDASSSPIRMLQRIGRTGRKRAGQIYMLLSESEEKKLDRSFDNYKYIQDVIAGEGSAGGGAGLRYNARQKMLPQEVTPECVEMEIEIPEENKELLRAQDIVKEAEMTQRATQKKKPASGKKRGSNQPAPKKRFNMPDGVITGFVSAKTAAAATAPVVVDLDGDLGSSDDDKPWFVQGTEATPKTAPKPKTSKAPKTIPPTKVATSKTKSAPKAIKTAPKPTTTSSSHAQALNTVYYYDAKRDGPDYGIVTSPAQVPRLPRPLSSSCPTTADAILNVKPTLKTSRTKAAPAPAAPASNNKQEYPPRLQKRSSKRFTELMETVSATDMESVERLGQSLSMDDCVARDVPVQASDEEQEGEKSDYELDFFGDSEDDEVQELRKPNGQKAMQKPLLKKKEEEKEEAPKKRSGKRSAAVVVVDLSDFEDDFTDNEFVDDDDDQNKDDATTTNNGVRARATKLRKTEQARADTPTSIVEGGPKQKTGGVGGTNLGPARGLDNLFSSDVDDGW